MAKYKVFDQVLAAIDKELAELDGKDGPDEHWLVQMLQEGRSKVEGLEGKFPTEAVQLKDVDVKYKARILKEELATTYLQQAFSVRIDRFNVGSAIHVEWKQMPGSAEEERGYGRIIGKYSYEYPDSKPLLDYCHVDNFAHGQGPSCRDWRREMKERWITGT